MGVLDGELGFVHPTQAVQRLYGQGRRVGPQLLVQLVEQDAAAGEVGVAGRDVRHPQRLLRGGVSRAVGAVRGARSLVTGNRWGRHRGREWWCPVQVGVVGQDRGLQVLQVPAGVDAQLVGEHVPGPPVDLQRLGLPAGPVQAQHQLPPQPLVQRIPGGQVLQFADQFRVASHRQVGPDAGGERAQPQFLQAGDLVAREGFLGELGQRNATPQSPVLLAGTAYPARCARLLHGRRDTEHHHRDHHHHALIKPLTTATRHPDAKGSPRNGATHLRRHPGEYGRCPLSGHDHRGAVRSDHSGQRVVRAATSFGWAGSRSKR